VNEPADAIRRLSAIPAVKAGRVARLPDDRVLRPGPQLPAALRQLQSAMQPTTQPAPHVPSPAGEAR
jgi:iron complex transport system substrate-binding protein